jgi:hypothetical protein
MKKLILFFYLSSISLSSFSQVMTTTTYVDVNMPYIELNPSFYNFSYPINSDIFNLNNFTPPNDGVYLKASYGHRYLSNTSTKTDNHGGFDFWPNHQYQGVTYDDSNKIDITSMCDGFISEVINGLDADLELTPYGRSVQVTCNKTSQAFGSTLKINYRHLSSLGALPAVAESSLPNSIAISKGDDIGVIGEIGTTTNVHLHLSAQANHPINGNSFIHPARLFDPTFYPQILQPLTNATIELLHTWNQSALFRITLPFNETINQFEFINNSFRVVFNKEEAYNTGSATRNNHDCIPNINIFAYQFNGKQTAMNSYENEKVNMPAIYPASPQRDAELSTYLYPHLPIINNNVSNVYDFVLNNLPSSYINNDFIVKLSDVWGNTVEGQLAAALGTNDHYQTQPAIKIFPNPTKDQITIHAPENNEILLIKVYTISGNFIKNRTMSSPSEVINLENLPSGIYVLKINSKNNTRNFKIVKK